jgi:hypothetical protein
MKVQIWYRTSNGLDRLREIDIALGVTLTLALLLRTPSCTGYDHIMLLTRNLLEPS